MDLIEFITKANPAGPKRIAGAAALNRAAEHICRLLRDARLLYEAESYATAAFLAITALEETAKAHLSIYMAEPSLGARRSKDPLYNHVKKHLLAALPSVAMGTRLPAAIGTARVSEILSDAREGRLVRDREAALYFQMKSGDVIVPSDLVRKDRARELILFAIEAFDDAIVGYTEHSYFLGRLADEMFSALADKPASAEP